MAIGLAGGLLGGLLGVGGGFVMVPLQVLWARVPQRQANATSLAAVLPTAIVGGVTHLREGNVLPSAALWMGFGGAAGAVIGAVVAVDAPEKLLARAFGVFLLFSAVRLATQARETQRPS